MPADAHPSASVVYAQVRRRLPRVSLGTVYRNLRRLAAEGLVQERAEPTGLRFDGNIAPHDHFTCVACGRVLDVPRRRLASSPPAPPPGWRSSAVASSSTAAAAPVAAAAFPFPRRAARLRAPEVALVVDHPNERARTVLSPETTRSLAAIWHDGAARPCSPWRRRSDSRGAVNREATSDPLVERGRQVYMSQCTQCHATDPAQAGRSGPPSRGASKALLEAKVLRGDYPPGYAPKRPTKVMPPMPALAPDINALAFAALPCA